MKEAVGGLSFVRNGIDILPFICGHYLRIGFSRLAFMDDGSTDGTYEFLESLSRRDSRVSVERIDLQSIEQGIEIKSAAANALISEGVQIIFPFDQDEFWNIDLDSVRAVAASQVSGVFIGMFVQFIQDGRVEDFGLPGALRVRYRAPVLASTTDKATRMGKPYLCFSKQKVGVKSAAPIVLGRGNHRLDAGPSNGVASDLEVFHLPLRCRSQVDKRSAEKRYPHMYLHDKASRQDRHNAWVASSADRAGCLTSEVGETIMLIPDKRLRNVLIRSFVYMALRYPSLLVKASWRARNEGC